MSIVLAGGAMDRQPTNFEHLDAQSDSRDYGAIDYFTAGSLFAIFYNKRY
jgi:hypothetical protein